VPVQLLLVPDWPNTQPAAAVLRQALDEVGLTAVPITTRIVYTRAGADRLGLPGSPTILIDGRDPANADRGSSTVRRPRQQHGARTGRQPHHPSLPDLANRRRNSSSPLLSADAMRRPERVR
jgi:hypothetical protein